MNQQLIPRLALYQSFFDRVAVLSRECQEKQITTERLADRVHGLVVDFHRALKGEQ